MKNDPLPQIETGRFTIKRKAQIVNAVRNHVAILADVCARYGISEDEFRSWETLLDKFGVLGLRASRLREYRTAEERATA